MAPRIAHLLLIAAACALVFGNALTNGFHLDDPHRVLDNPGVQELWPPWRHFVDPSTSAALPRLVQYRPLLPLSLSINHAISGGSAVGYHVGNLLLQFLASVFVYAFARELLTHWSKRPFSKHAPLLVALLFAVHPVSGVPVNYVCARDLLLMQTFLMACLFAYARMRRLGETTGRWVVCLALLLLAMLGKKNAVMAPVLILLFELLPGGQSLRDGAVWRRVLPFAALVGGLVLFIRFGLGFSDFENVVVETSNAGQYLAGQVQHHVFHYLRNFVWPFPMRPGAADPHVAWQQVVGAAVLIGSWVLAWRLRRSEPLLAMSILGYQALMVLTSSVLPLHSEIVAYRAYPSSAFLFLGVVVWVQRLAKRAPRVGTPLLIAAVVYFGISSFVMNRTWQDSVTLWRHSVAYGATNMAVTQLAEALPDGPEKAEMFRRAMAMNPTDAMADIGLASVEIRTGQREAGLNRFRNAVQRLPQNAQVRYAYAQGLSAAGMKAEAATEARRAVELDPNNFDYRCQAAAFAIEVKQNAAALQILEPLLRDHPGYRGTRYFAAVALFNMNRAAEAIQLLELYVRQYPQDDQAWFNLGFARMTQNAFQAAIPALESCLRANPMKREAHRLLAECYGRTGNQAAADQHARIYQGR